MRWMLLFIITVTLGLTGYTLFKVRTATHDPEVWHVDPLTAPLPETPNGFRVAPEEMASVPVDLEAPIYDSGVILIAHALDTFLSEQPRIEMVAGSLGEGWVTYVQRSEKLRFPDYISIRFIPLGEDSSTIAIYSRARYGYSDMGVNEARVRSWLASLHSFER